MNAQDAMAKPVRHSRMAMWRHQHAWCLRDSLRQLARRPLGSALTIAVMGLALALPLAFYLLLVNVQHLAAALGDSQSVSVFLKPAVTAEGADKLAASLRARPDVGAVAIRTPRQGLAELAAMQGFGDAIKSLPDNPLPFALLIEPRAGAGRAQVEAMVQALRALPDVDLVQDNGQWRARLDALIALGRRVTLLLAVLLSAAALLVIGNTVRLDIRSRADEIAVQQLIGASAAFVRRPYLYEGAWYGLAAGIVAVLLVVLLEAVLAAPVRDLVASYAGRLRFGGLSWVTLAMALAVAVALGWLGAWVASSRHLARLQP
ncbi:MAG: Cell-division-associated, ABC-transporter-like signaling protein FtsX [Rhodanobacteraceae bacterium]|jgi:cell division transport system permease protein|nr:MAG: Cell-division-associated, ABC-transporter-like signaling protein FtsX [Rhodanobacteraceae bacterium]